MKLNTAEEMIAAIKNGEMVVLMDDADRENEGDLVMAAEKIDAQSVNFMAKHGRGLICLTLTQSRCEQLQLPLMVKENGAPLLTNFTVSIDAAEDISTGISASDRANTIHKAIKQDATPEDIVMPGHIFPIMAKPGGILVRAGHTEASVDLARLGGLSPAGVIVEILNEDGSMAREPQLKTFAQLHQLKIGTIADLIRYRIENEKTVEPVADCFMPSLYGDFQLRAFKDSIDNQVHLALIYGKIESDQGVLVRVHMEDPLSDVLNSTREGGAWPLREAMKRIVEEKAGIIVILRKNIDCDTLLDQINGFQGIDEGKKKHRVVHRDEIRTYGLGAQILVELGVRKMRVLGTPKKMVSISGFGLELVEYVSCD